MALGNGLAAAHVAFRPRATTREPTSSAERRIVHAVHTAVGLVVAAVGGVAIAFVESAPSWDDTGITVVALVVIAAVAAFIARRRPWVVALLVGAPTPLVELAHHGQPAALAALAFAALGATIGWSARRAGGPPTSSR